MNALACLTEAREAGVKVTLEGGKIILEGDFTSEMLAGFKANKPEILRLLKSVPASDPKVEPQDEAMDSAMGLRCDDCGRLTSVAIVTDYGARYCRECVFPSEAKPTQTRTLLAVQGKLEPHDMGTTSGPPEPAAQVCHLLRVRPGTSVTAEEQEALAAHLRAMGDTAGAAAVRLFDYWRATPKPSMSAFLAREPASKFSTNEEDRK